MRSSVTLLAPSWPKMRFGAHLGLHLDGYWGASWRQDGAKLANLAPRWSQDGPSWAPDRHLEASWGAILAILKGLGADFGKNGRHVKMSITMAFWPHFGVLAGLAGGSWRLCWFILALCWAMLGHLGAILEQLGDKMWTESAKMSQDSGQERQDEARWRKWAARERNWEPHGGSDRRRGPRAGGGVPP